ncbi:MAG: transposase [Alphaproteobacteria bacterium]|nr:MAG: transposase [Alphaproteobacteria bacterium]
MQKQLVPKPNRDFGLDAAGLSQGLLTDGRWERVAAALPMGLHSQTNRGLTTRRFIEAVLWAAEMDATWSQLPRNYGNYQALSQRFDRWVRLDIWSVVMMQLEGDKRVPALERMVVSRSEVFTRRSSRQALSSNPCGEMAPA